MLAAVILASCRSRRSLVCVLLTLVLGCGPGTGGDEGAGGSGTGSATAAGSETGGGSATLGIDDAGGDGECRELVPCLPFELEVTGFCLASAYTWDGIDCVEVSGCECTGPDCCHLTETREECLAAVTDTCDALPFCLECPAGTECFTVCDHVGTGLDSWCAEVTEDCGPMCVCEANGYAEGSCELAHPQAHECGI